MFSEFLLMVLNDGDDQNVSWELFGSLSARNFKVLILRLQRDVERMRVKHNGAWWVCCVIHYRLRLCICWICFSRDNYTSSQTLFKKASKQDCNNIYLHSFSSNFSSTLFENVSLFAKLISPVDWRLSLFNCKVLLTDNLHFLVSQLKLRRKLQKFWVR